MTESSKNNYYVYARCEQAHPIFALISVLITGCKKDISEVASVRPELQNQLPSAKATKLTGEQQAKLKTLVASLPADYKSRMKISTKFFSKFMWSIDIL